MLALYVLSTGPEVRLEQAGYLPRGTMEAVYAPLWAVAPPSSPQNDIMFWYIFSVWRADIPAIIRLER